MTNSTNLSTGVIDLSEIIGEYLFDDLTILTDLTALDATAHILVKQMSLFDLMEIVI